MYQLTLTKEQLEAMLPALDLAFRLHIGQLNMINEFLSMHVKTPNNVPMFDDQVMYHLQQIKKIYFNFESVGAGYSILNQEVSDRARTLVDIYDVIRHRLAWDDAGNPEQRRADMIQVWYDTPRQSGNEPMPVIEKL